MPEATHPYKPIKSKYYTPCPTVPDSPNHDYSKICEYDGFDPYHNSRVDFLVGLDHDTPETTYVVYLDENSGIIWCSKNKDRKASPQMRSVLRRMSFIDTMPTDHLEANRKRELKWLLAEGLKHFLSCREDAAQLKDAEATAMATFDEAERRINQWNYEFVRFWYTIVAGIVLLVVAVLTFWILQPADHPEIGWELTQYAFAGSLGAVLFFLVRLHTTPPDQLRYEVSGTQFGSYLMVVVAKTLVGAIGAIVIGLAIKGNLVLGITKNGTDSMDHPFNISIFTFMACFVAGFSETLVPRFLSTFERGNDFSAAPTERKPAQRRR
jgi:hypothetical protein